MVDEFLATLTGAVIAGAIGVVAVFVGEWIRSRREFDERILSAVYDRVIAIENTHWLGGLPEGPLTNLDQYFQLRIPPRVTKALRAFSDAYLMHDKCYWEYRKFMDRANAGSPLKNFMDVLSATYGVPAEQNLDTRRFGQDQGGPIPPQYVFPSLYTLVIRHREDEAAAWREAGRSEGAMYWTTVLVRYLLENDEKTLHVLHERLGADPHSKEGQPIVSRLLEAHRASFYGAVDLEKVLVSRLIWLPWRRRTLFDSPDDQYMHLIGEK